MASDRDLPRRPLLAGGEKLKLETVRSAGGGPKFHPATIGEAYAALRPQAEALATAVTRLPDAMCGEHVVFEAMVHPNYIANSYFPGAVFADADVYVVGTRRAAAPYKTKTSVKADAPTKSFLLAGTRGRVETFAAMIAQPPHETSVKWEQLAQFREIGLMSPERVIRKMPDSLPSGELITWEAVLSPIGRTAKEVTAWGDAAFEKFVKLVRHLGGDVDVAYRRTIDGVSFVPLALHREGIEQAARFNLLRALRPMPKIRPVRPLRRSVGALKPPDPPTTKKAASDMRVAIFDGGLDPKVAHFAPYVNVHHLTTEAATDDDQAHGALVTSAFLYGHIDGAALPQPVANVDHYRVFPLPASSNIDHSLTWLLDQITKVVERGQHRFVNLSLGPNEAVDEDDEPHQWTLTLDKLAKRYDVTFHCAVGNNGEDDPVSGMHRVLVPSDMVNGIGVGSCDSYDPSKPLVRAEYSAFGPGRYGLRTQPLGVTFGGREQSISPFIGIDHRGGLATDAGTSYSTPLAMRGSVEVAISLPPASATSRTVRTFVAHHATPRARGHKIAELGLGRIRHRYSDIWDCASSTCCVLYEDKLARGEVVAMHLPVPEKGIPPTSKLELLWTISFLSDTDPSDAFEYTNSGLEVTFRPNSRRVSIKDVTARNKSLGIFDLVNDAAHLRQLATQKVIEVGLPEAGKWKRHRAEIKQRDEGKWETVIRGNASLEAGALFKPRIDLNHLRREGGQLLEGDGVAPLDISMLVTVRAPTGVALYDRVRAEFPVLIPLAVTVPVPVGAT